MLFNYDFYFTYPKIGYKEELMYWSNIFLQNSFISL